MQITAPHGENFSTSRRCGVSPTDSGERMVALRTCALGRCDVYAYGGRC